MIPFFRNSLKVRKPYVGEPNMGKGEVPVNLEEGFAKILEDYLNHQNLVNQKFGTYTVTPTQHDNHWVIYHFIKFGEKSSYGIFNTISLIWVLSS